MTPAPETRTLSLAGWLPNPHGPRPDAYSGRPHAARRFPRGGAALHPAPARQAPQAAEQPSSRPGTRLLRARHDRPAPAAHGKGKAADPPAPPLTTAPAQAALPPLPLYRRLREAAQPPRGPGEDAGQAGARQAGGRAAPWPAVPSAARGGAGRAGNAQRRGRGQVWSAQRVPAAAAPRSRSRSRSPSEPLRSGGPCPALGWV